MSLKVFDDFDSFNRLKNLAACMWFIALFDEAEYNLGKIKIKGMPWFCLRYLRGLQVGKFFKDQL